MKDLVAEFVKSFGTCQRFKADRQPCAFVAATPALTHTKVAVGQHRLGRCTSGRSLQRHGVQCGIDRYGQSYANGSPDPDFE